MADRGAGAGTGPAERRVRPLSREAAPRPLGSVRRSFAPWADPAAVPLIRFEAVTRRFGTVTAVDGVDLDIHDREFFCLLGPSGCGKTTLMRMLAGFEEPSSGRITLAGQDLAGLPPHRRPVNMMFQSYALFPHMSVARNIGFGLRQEGLPRSEIEDRVASILKLVQLEGFGDRRPDQLSGGQKQRVALARALVKRPKVLLLDEPLGALDKKLREETQFELMDLQVELGMTFLVVTHDQDEAMTMADRIGVMDRGRLAQVGTPAEIYEAPRSRDVARFVGDITLFEGQVVALHDDSAEIHGPGDDGACRFKVELSGQERDGLAVGQAVALGVRPEKLELHAGPSRPLLDNVMAGEIWDIGYLGDWTTYRVRLDDGTIVKVSRANATRGVAQPLDWDDRVWLSFAPSAAVVLTR